MSHGGPLRFPVCADSLGRYAASDQIVPWRSRQAWYKLKDVNQNILVLPSHDIGWRLSRCRADSYKAINDEGMPMYRRSFMKGKLYIHFQVDFPDSLSPEQISALQNVLPPKPASELTDMEPHEC